MIIDLQVTVEISDDQAEVLEEIMTQGFQEKLSRKMGNYLHRKLDTKLMKKKFGENGKNAQVH